MRKLLHATAALAAFLAMSSAANAADMRVKAPPPAPMPPPFSWAGFYFGGNLGGAWAHADVTDSLFGLDFGNNNHNGVFIGGGQVGFNYQESNFVIGLEGDFDGAENNNNTNNGVFVPAPVGQTILVTASNRWVATVAARLGVAFDRVLFYGKAGAGWVGFDGFTVTNVNSGVSIVVSGSDSAAGGLGGAGVEWAFADNCSAKIEYDYFALGRRTLTVPAGSPFLVGDTFSTGNRSVQMAKVGINYRFNWGSSSPVTTKY